MVLVYDDWGAPWFASGARDWARHVSIVEAGSRAVLKYHELPFWNPFPCGGVPALAHPESRTLTPFFLTALLASTRISIQWDVVLHGIIAVVGTWLLAAAHLRKHQGEVLAAPLAAAIFALSTVFALHIEEGHLNWIPAAYLPWIVYFFEQATKPQRLHHACYGGVGLALMIGEGATYPATHTTMLVALYAMLIWLFERNRRALMAGVLTVTSGLCFAGPKVLPMLELLSRRPRHAPSGDTIPLEGLWASIVNGHQASTQPHHPWMPWAWHEYGHYVGLLGCALAVYGLVVGGRRARALGILTVTFLVLGAGAFATWAPWAILHELPGFRSQHVPSRFLLGALLPIALLASTGLSALVRGLDERRRAVACITLTLVATLDLFVVRNAATVREVCPSAPWPKDAPKGGPFLTMQGLPGESVCLPRPVEGRCACSVTSVVEAADAGVAIIDSNEPLCPHNNPFDYIGRVPGLTPFGHPDYRGEVWLEPNAGTAQLVRHTANSFVVRVEASRPTILTFNQNGDPGWSVDDAAVGPPVSDEQQRLSLRIPAGNRTLTVRYFPPRFGWGLALAALALAGFVVLRRQQRRAARDCI